MRKKQKSCNEVIQIIKDMEEETDRYGNPIWCQDTLEEIQIRIKK